MKRKNDESDKKSENNYYTNFQKERIAINILRFGALWNLSLTRPPSYSVGSFRSAAA